jgi:hypothetical protein
VIQPKENKLTDEALDMLADARRGLMMTKSASLRRIAEENGIIIKEGDSAMSILKKLENKRDGIIEEPIPEEKIEPKKEEIIPEAPINKNIKEVPADKEKEGGVLKEMKMKRVGMRAQVMKSKMAKKPGQPDSAILIKMKAELAELELKIEEAEEKEKLATKSEPENSEEIRKQFEKDFSFAEDELKTLEGKAEMPDGKEKTIKWTDLSSGQQLVLLENLKEFALSNAKEQALKKYTEDEKKSFEEAGWVRRVILGATKTYRRARDLAKNERDILLDSGANKEMYREVLQEMLVMAADAPEMETKDGKTELKLATVKDFEGIDLKALGKEGILDEFNRISEEFSHIPSEWAYSKDEKELEQYNSTKAAYAKARGELLNLKTEILKNEDEAADYIVSLDRKVHFNQLFNINPEVEKIFASKTEEKNLWKAFSTKPKDLREYWSGISGALDKEEVWQGMKAATTEKGGLFLGGLVIRGGSMVGAAAVAAELGMLGAGMATGGLTYVIGYGAMSGALSGGLIGGYMAKKREELEIADKKELAQMGIVDESNKKDYRTISENGDINDVIRLESGVPQITKKGEIGTGLLDKLEFAINRVREAEDAGEFELAKYALALKALGDRLYYTEKKIAEGLVNFGEGKDSLKNRYDLSLALNTARILQKMNEPEMKRKIMIQVEEMVDGKKVKTGKTEEREIDEKQRIDALLGKKTGDIAKKESEQKREKIIKGLKYGAFLGGLFGAGFSWLGYNHTHSGEDVAIPPVGGAGKNVVAEVVEQKPVSVADELTKQVQKGSPIENHAAGTPVKINVVQEGGPTVYTTHPAGGSNNLTENIDLHNVRPGEESTISAVKIPNDFANEASLHVNTHNVEDRLSDIAHSLQKLSEPHTVLKDENIWNIFKSRLGDNEYFNNLSRRDQNFILDSLKDKVTHLSKNELFEMGIKSKNPNLIYPGDKIDFSKIINENTDLVRIFNRVHGLTENATTPSSILSQTETPVVSVNTVSPTTEILNPPQIETIDLPAPIAEAVQPQTIAIPTDITAKNPDIITINTHISPEEAALATVLTVGAIKGTIAELNKNIPASAEKIDAKNEENPVQEDNNREKDPYHEAPLDKIPKEYRKWAFENDTIKIRLEHTPLEKQKELEKELFGISIEERTKKTNEKETLKKIAAIARAYDLKAPRTLSEIPKNESIGEYISREAWRNSETNKSKKYSISEPSYILQTLKKEQTV